MADTTSTTTDEPTFPIECHEGPVHVLRDSSRGIGVVMSNAPLITAGSFLGMMPLSAYLAYYHNLEPIVEIISYTFPPFGATVMICGWWAERQKLSRFYFNIQRRVLTLAGPAHGDAEPIPFDRIAQLQVIPGGEHRFKGSGKRGFFIDVYELNVVLNEPEPSDEDEQKSGAASVTPRRVNLICHGNPKLLVDDAKAIAARTGLPLVVSAKVPADQVIVKVRPDRGDDDKGKADKSGPAADTKPEAAA
ncbi:MAG: hypothetical protein GC159_15960 [Phycisphaera sp.]|nr:hypothetical protein [Phycisphaera sp.]